MNLIIFAWIILCSLLPLLFMPVLPGPKLLLLISATALILLRSRSLLGWGAGWAGLIFCWGVLNACQQLKRIDELTGRPVSTIVSVTASEPGRERIKVRIHQSEGKLQYPALSAWLFTGESVADFCPGQRWSMRLRLRPVHGNLNEGGYDQQRNALAGYSPLQGRILDKTPLLSDCSLRQRIINRVNMETEGLASQGVLRALLFGLRDTIPLSTSKLFRDTGVAHLMAISGMHIGLAGAFGWWIARGIQRGLPPRFIRRWLPQACSWGLAAIYTWISGSQAPALRAMLALTLWIIIRHCRLNLNSWQVWVCCAAVLLVSDPMLVLSDSFWLSMLAVLMLLVWYRWFALPLRYRQLRRWFFLRLLHLQLGMMLLMLPVQALLFNGISLCSLPANLLAIPVISLLTLPLSAMAIFLMLPGLSGIFWQLADKSLIFLTVGLEAQPESWLTVTDFGLWSVLAWGGLLFYRAGAWAAYKASGITLLLCCLLWRYPQSNEQWRADMLDVGHGLAIVISQGKEAVVYDTGNRWPQGDAGERIIIPWLLRHQMDLQQVIISHQHLDHYGGLKSLRARWPATPVRTSTGRKTYLPCFRGEQWQWKKLTFSVLWPPPGRTGGRNDDSCVIKVTDGRYSLLLTGDIERRAEMELARLEKEVLQSTFIQVPHHGSNTSSVPPFLRRVNGEIALASLARYNSWKMPSAAVITRYRKAGFRWLDTAVSGQISLRIYKDNFQVLEMREQIFPRWYHQWFGVKAQSG